MKTRNHFFALLILVALFCMSCSMGLGDEPDLEPPTVTITTPAPLSYVKTHTILKGTCRDNRKVRRITVVNAITKDSYGTGSINGEEWTANVTLPEGELTLEITAYDENTNTSVNSIKRITLLVDDTAPEGVAWYIDRGNAIQGFLDELDALKAVDTGISKNKDVPQNEFFTLKGSLIDSLTVESVTLHVKSEDKTPLFNVVNTGSSPYSPVFKISAADLINKDAAYASGKHYLFFSYTSKDEAGNEGEHDLLYAMWEQESDKPHIAQNQEVDNVLCVPVSSSIPVDFFDDDELKSIRYDLISSDAYSGISGATDEAKIATLIANSALAESLLKKTETMVNSPRDYSITIDADATPAVKYLIALAEDSSSHRSPITPKWGGRIIQVQITDAENPILFITDPKENTVPSIKAGETSKFEITGYALDTKGCNSLKIAFIPDGLYDSAEEKREAGKAAIENNPLAAGASKTLDSGIKIYAATLVDDGTQASGDVSWKKQNFTLTLDLLSDFKCNGTLENKNKFFELQLTDSDNNVVYQDFRLSGDTVAPEVTVTYPASDLQSHDTRNDLILTYTASKPSGLGIKSASLKITEIIGETEVTRATTSTYTISKASLVNGTQRTFRFYAEDLLGNKSNAQRTVVFNTLPSLTKITTNAMNGTYKAEDVITFQAVFSAAVKVTGTPKLRIKYTASDASPKEATYTSGSGTDTLQFNFTVPAGATSAKLYCDATNPFSLTGTAKIETAEAGGGDAYTDTLTTGNKLEELKTIALDGVAPTITSLSCNNGTAGWFAEGNVITAKITASEPLRVSGSPTLNLNVGATTVTFAFQSISDSVITFVHTVTNSTPEGTLSYNCTSALTAAASSITDTVGNTISLTGAPSGTTSVVIDRTAPVAPTINIATGIYNVNKTLTVSDAEADATVYYSINGGISWTEYTAGVTLGSGTYQLTAKQHDKAGNESPLAPTADVEINADFPTVDDISCTLPDGTYPAGTKLTFKLSFAEKVKSGATAYLELFTTGSGKHAVVTPEATGSNALTFTYTVQNGDSATALSVKSATLTGVTDMYGNTPAANAAAAVITASGTRSGISIDGIKPSVATRVPAVDAVTASNVIKLTFNENVYKESGMITLRRTAHWYIPPVLTLDEFNKIKNELSETDQEILMQTENGSVKLHEKTGQPVGPYQKITHGLVLSGANYIPDVETKYVLDFQYNINDTTGTVADLREVLEKAGYHKQTLDVTSSAITISGKVVTITFPTALANGEEWELLIDEGAFRDNAGNRFSGFETGDYVFNSDKVSTPVVRVDRYSHGWGAKEPNASGVITEIPTNGDITTRPTGYARVRIDSQTRGATIQYTVHKMDSTSAAVAIGNQPNPNPALYRTADIAATKFATTPPATAYTSNTFIIVGDGEITTARKDYIAAEATKMGFTKSDLGFEGVFKTTVILWHNGRSDTVRIQGGTTEGGMPTISGFPLRDADLDPRFGKYAYGPQNRTWYWISYDIVSDFSQLSLRSNYAQTYNDSSYGSLTYCYNQSYY